MKEDSNGKNGNPPIIKTLVVRRDPNLETILFGALVTRFERIARNLGITTGKLQFRFISTATACLNGGQHRAGGIISEELLKQLEVAREEAAGLAHFNVGGQGMRGWDSHGRSDGDKVCSLAVAMADHDFRARRRYLEPLVFAVMANDITGNHISRHQHNLRELVTSLGDLMPDKPEELLEWGMLAFYGIFEQAQAGTAFKQLFTPNSIKTGVKSYLEDWTRKAQPLSTTEASQKWLWFETLLTQAIENINTAWQEAQDAVKSAEEKKRTATIYVPNLGQRVKMIELVTASYKAPAATRKAGYNLIIHWNPDGHCQIHSGIVDCSDGRRKAIDMGAIALALRRQEVSSMGKKLRPGQDLTGVGMVYAEDGTAVPWYVPHFGTGCYNGSRSSADVAQTRFKRHGLFEVIKQAAVLCQTVDRGPTKQAQKDTATANAEEAPAEVEVTAQRS